MSDLAYLRVASEAAAALRVVLVGAPAVVEAHFRGNVAVTSRPKGRPTRADRELLGGYDDAPFVLLDDLDPDDAFLWAAAVPPGAIIAIRSHRVPALGRVRCGRFMSRGALPDDLTLWRREPYPPATSAPPPPKTPWPGRPLRIAFLGDPYYVSAYRIGVEQAAASLGMLYGAVSIRQTPTAIDAQVRNLRPDIVFTHMLLWPPAGGASIPALLDLCEQWRRGWSARILLHDGDPRAATRFAHDVSGAVDLALLNHRHDRSAWKVPTLYWPYAAFAQPRIADLHPDLACGLAFTGRLREGEPLYDDRTRTLRAVDAALRARANEVAFFPRTDGPFAGVNTRLMTAEMAASAAAMLGFGRDVPGWIDTRVFQYPGAGGILLHDDVHSEFTGLVPDEHYIAVPRYGVDAIVAAYDGLCRWSEADRRALRERAFAHVQANHTYVHRVQAVLDAFYGSAGVAPAP